MQSQKKILYFKEGDIILEQGDSSSQMYFLQKGIVQVFKVDEGEDIHLGNINVGELFGEMSFLDGEPRSASVRALTQCEIVEIPKRDFDNLLKSQPSWLRILIRTLVERLRKTNEKVRV